MAKPLRKQNPSGPRLKDIPKDGIESGAAYALLEAAKTYVNALRQAGVTGPQLKTAVSNGLTAQIKDINQAVDLSKDTKTQVITEIQKIQKSIQSESPSYPEKFKAAVKQQAKQSLADKIRESSAIKIADIIGQLMGKGKLSDRLADPFDVKKQKAQAEKNLVEATGDITSPKDTPTSTSPRRMSPNDAAKMLQSGMGPAWAKSTSPAVVSDAARRAKAEADLEREATAAPPDQTAAEMLEVTYTIANNTGEMVETLQKIHDFMVKDLVDVIKESGGGSGGLMNLFRRGGGAGGAAETAAAETAGVTEGAAGAGSALAGGTLASTLAFTGGGALGGAAFLGAFKSIGGRAVSQASVYRKAQEYGLDQSGGTKAISKRIREYEKKKGLPPSKQGTMYSEDSEETTSPASTETNKGGDAAATGALQFGTDSGSQSNFNALDSQIKDKVEAAAIQYKEQTGRPIKINSAKRDSKKQQKLWDESVKAGRPGIGPSGMAIAKPGRSRHERGVAVDIQNYNDPAAVQAMNSQGLFQDVPGDPVHFQLRGGTEGSDVDGTSPARTSSTETKVGGVAVARNGQPVDLSPEEQTRVAAAKNLSNMMSGSIAGTPTTGGGTSPAAMSYSSPSMTRAAAPVSAGTAAVEAGQAAAPAMIIAGNMAAQQPPAPSVQSMMPIPIPIRPRSEDTMLRSLQAVNIF